MCATIYCNETDTIDLQNLKKIKDEINNSEKELELAQESFNQLILESTAAINSLRLKSRHCVTKIIKFRNQELPKELKCTDVSGKHNDGNDRKVHHLQKELEKVIKNSGLSVKRSLMHLSSLVAQHELLFLPYYELKAYFNQLFNQKIEEVKLNSSIKKPKLSYAEALQTIEEISYNIEESKNRIENLTKRNENLDLSPLQFLNDFTNEYKSMPEYSIK